METNSIYHSNNDPFINFHPSRDQKQESELQARVDAVFEEIIDNQDESVKLRSFDPAVRDQILDKVHHLIPNQFARDVLKEGAQSNPETVDLVVSDTLDSNEPEEFFRQITVIKDLIRGALLKLDSESLAHSSLERQSQALNQETLTDPSITVALSTDQPETDPQISEEILQTAQPNASVFSKPLSEEVKRHLPQTLAYFFENKDKAQNLVDIQEIGNQVSVTLNVYDQKVTYFFEDGLWASETRINLKNDQVSHFDVTSQQLNDYLREGFTQAKERQIIDEINRAINLTRSS